MGSIAPMQAMKKKSSFLPDQYHIVQNHVYIIAIPVRFNLFQGRPNVGPALKVTTAEIKALYKQLSVTGANIPY